MYVLKYILLNIVKYIFYLTTITGMIYFVILVCNCLVCNYLYPCLVLYSSVNSSLIE